MKSYKKYGTDDMALQKIQQNVEEVLTPVLNAPIVNGRLLTVALTAGTTNIIPHQLGREYLGWMDAGKNANAAIWEEAGNPRKNRTLWLQTTADVTMNIWVF